MTCFVLLLIAYGALALETVLTGLLPAAAVPDTLAALVLAWCLVAPARLTTWGAAMLGLLSDLNGSGRLGFGVALAVTVAMVLVRLRGPAATDDWPRRIIATLGAALVMVLLAVLRERLALADGMATGGWFLPGVSMALVTAALALACVPALRSLFGRNWRRSAAF
ncbi:MAG: hypothetical protein JSS27_14775 [Planctomycetes bacterium]|nr:hypothetical protein [Planctomycetota bacterium]